MTGCCNLGGLLKKLEQFIGIAESILSGSGPKHKGFHMYYVFSPFFLQPFLGLFQFLSSLVSALVSFVSSKQLLTIFRFTMQASYPEVGSQEENSCYLPICFILDFCKGKYPRQSARRKTVRAEKSCLYKYCVVEVMLSVLMSDINGARLAETCPKSCSKSCLNKIKRLKCCTTFRK